jgi:hypothetical protein
VVRIEMEDRDNILLEATMVKSISLESMRFRPVAYAARMANACVRAVGASYGEMRSEVAAKGRWISPEDESGQGDLDLTMSVGLALVSTLVLVGAVSGLVPAL